MRPISEQTILITGATDGLGRAVATELASHTRPEVREAMQPFTFALPMEPEDIADAVVYIVTRPWRMAVNEMLIRPTELI